MAAEGLHVVMFPMLAFGHISPFVQLTNKLSIHAVRVTFLSAPGNIKRIKNSLIPSPNIQVEPITIPQVDGLAQGLESTSETTPHEAELLKIAIDLMQPQIQTLLSQLKPHFVICDFVYNWLPKLASQLSIKTAFFSVYSAVSSAYDMVPSRTKGVPGYVPTIEELMKPPNGFPLESSKVDGIQRFQAMDLSYIYKRFGSPSVFERSSQVTNDCSALLFKTCHEMEGPYVNFIETQFKKPILLTGPLVPEPSIDILEEKWAVWLSQFASKSVIFCSFGSETSLTNDQIQELALGLELTGSPFVLVLNFPSGVNIEAELEKALPRGFVERVKSRGMVQTGWVQQRLILAHENVGCYLCHSGFSSVVEGLISDCQLVLLPMKGDQFINSKLLANDMKAGIEVKRREEDGFFFKEDVLEAVKTVMVETDKEPGASIRANHKKWRDFLLNKEVHDKYIVDLVVKLKALVA